MNESFLADFVDQMKQAAADACGFVDGLNKEAFLSDKRTQRAVVMSLVIQGEAATRIMDRFPDLTNEYPQNPWRGMRGLRNRIAHGYFDLDIVWETVNTALPALSKQLSDLRDNPLDDRSSKSES